MLDTIDLVRLTIAERHLEAERGRLATLASRFASCCSPATLRSRIAAAIRGARSSRGSTHASVSDCAAGLAAGC